MGRQGQSFRLACPLGQGHRGFENPRLFKDRPTDGKRSGMRRILLAIGVFNGADNRMSLPSFRNLQRHAVAHYFAAAIVAQAPASTCTPSQKISHAFSPPMQPRPKDGLSIAENGTDLQVMALPLHPYKPRGQTLLAHTPSVHKIRLQLQHAIRHRQTRHHD